MDLQANRNILLVFVSASWENMNVWAVSHPSGWTKDEHKQPGMVEYRQLKTEQKNELSVPGGEMKKKTIRHEYLDRMQDALNTFSENVGALQAALCQMKEKRIET